MLVKYARRARLLSITMRKFRFRVPSLFTVIDCKGVYRPLLWRLSMPICVKKDHDDDDYDDHDDDDDDDDDVMI
jgi:hypothetical protein